MHEFFFENLRNPVRNRRAGLMRQFRSGLLDSSSKRYILSVFALEGLTYFGGENWPRFQVSKYIL